MTKRSEGSQKEQKAGEDQQQGGSQPEQDVTLPQHARAGAQPKQVNLEDDPTVKARPELSEHGLTKKNAPENRVQVSQEEIDKAAKKAERGKE